MDAARRLRLPASWLTWLVVAGLAAVYAGERIVPQVTAARVTLTGAGTLLVLAAAFVRGLRWRRARGDARGVEGLFLVTYAGCALALAGFLAAGPGMRWLGPLFDDAAGAARFSTAATVVACILLAASLLPALAAQWAARSNSGPDGSAASAIDRLRVAQLGAAGLVVGLALPFLMLTGYVASEHDRTLDLSYFRTASPGTASRQVAQSLGEPLRVLLFFPPASEVADQVRGYFRALAVASDRVRIEEHDRLAAPSVAQEHNVTQDGTVVLAVGDRTERLTLPVRLSEARRRLRALDGDVQQALMRVAREERTVYLTVGHGELNDATPAGPADLPQLGSIDALRSLFRLLNYRVQDLGVQSGLGSDVPADAAMVLVLGPRRPFLEPELAALDRYLARGGSVLLALEPETEFRLGPLRERLGIDFRGTPLADDRQHLRLRGNLSDRRLIVTDRFSSHAAVATVSQAGMGAGVLFMGAGHLEPTGDGPRVTVTVRSLPSTFADESLDFEFVDGREERRAYPLAAAVEGEAEGPDDAPDATPATGGMRALVFADAELFSDAVLASLGLNAALAADAVRWLGREEELAGEIASEEDVPIVHTRAEDVAWFYSTILGAPALVLLAGLFGARVRRRRGRPTEEEAS